MVNAAKPRRPKSRRSRWSNVERPLATGRWLLHRLQAPRRVTLFLPLPSQVSVSFYSCRCIPVCPSPTFHRFPLLLVHRPSYPYTGIRSLKPPRQKAKPAPPPCVRAASSSSFFHPVPPPPPPPPPLQPSYQRPVDDRRPSSSPPPWLGQGPNGRLFQTMLSMRFSKPILFERADFAFAILSFFFPIVNNWFFIWIVIFRDDDFILSVTISSVISSFFFFVDRNFWLR